MCPLLTPKKVEYKHRYQEEFEDTKEQSDSVYRRRTDSTMAKRKSTKGQTTIYETYI